MQKWAKQSGFTIVELLIVIVVIAILAAITIVAYNGIRQSTEQSALLSNLSQQAKKLQTWNNVNGDIFPSSLADARSKGMLADAANTTYVEYLTSPDLKNYCATAARDSGIVFSISSAASAPVPGRCVENIVTNPSFEVNTSDWTLGGAAPTMNRIAGGQQGGFRIQLTKASPVSDAQVNTTGPLVADSTYSIAYWAWSNTTSCLAGTQFSRNNGGYSPFATTSSTLTTSPALQRATGVSPAGSTQYRWRITPCQDGTSTVYYDGFTAVRGDYQLKTTYDGTSPGWFWTGSPHASSSIGPAETL